MNFDEEFSEMTDEKRNINIILDVGKTNFERELKNGLGEEIRHNLEHPVIPTKKMIRRQKWITFKYKLKKLFE